MKAWIIIWFLFLNCSLTAKEYHNFLSPKSNFMKTDVCNFFGQKIAKAPLLQIIKNLRKRHQRVVVYHGSRLNSLFIMSKPEYRQEKIISADEAARLGIPVLSGEGAKGTGLQGTITKPEVISTSEEFSKANFYASHFGLRSEQEVLSEISQIEKQLSDPIMTTTDQDKKFKERQLKQKRDYLENIRKFDIEDLKKHDVPLIFGISAEAFTEQGEKYNYSHLEGEIEISGNVSLKNVSIIYVQKESHIPLAKKLLFLMGHEDIPISVMAVGKIEGFVTKKIAESLIDYNDFKNSALAFELITNDDLIKIYESIVNGNLNMEKLIIDLKKRAKEHLENDILKKLPPTIENGNIKKSLVRMQHLSRQSELFNMQIKKLKLSKLNLEGLSLPQKTPLNEVSGNLDEIGNMSTLLQGSFDITNAMGSDLRGISVFKNEANETSQKPETIDLKEAKFDNISLDGINLKDVGSLNGLTNKDIGGLDDIEDPISFDKTIQLLNAIQEKKLIKHFDAKMLPLQNDVFRLIEVHNVDLKKLIAEKSGLKLTDFFNSKIEKELNFETLRVTANTIGTDFIQINKETISPSQTFLDNLEALTPIQEVINNLEWQSTVTKKTLTKSLQKKITSKLGKMFGARPLLNKLRKSQKAPISS